MQVRARWMTLIGLALTVGCGPSDGPNRPPTISGSPQSTPEDVSLQATMTASDLDGDALEFRYTGVSHGTVTGVGPMFTYTPAPDYNGADAVTVTVLDGEAQATAIIAIEVIAVNDPPVAMADGLAALENTPLVAPLAALTANDTDVDGDALTVTQVSAGANGTVAIEGDQLRFIPTSGFVGAASFSYTVSDGVEAVEAPVTVTVGDVNDPPVATDDVATTAEDTPAMITAATLTANDTDPEGQTLAVTAVADAVHGTVALVGATITFTPEPDYVGAAAFDYTVSDGAATDVGTVAITITPVQDAPVAVDDAATTEEDTPLVVAAATLAANDVDVDGDALTVIAVANPSGGTVALVAGTVTFTPAPNLTGTAGFDYTVSDGGRTDVGHVAITVTPVPDAPVAGDDVATTDEDTPLMIPGATLTANDADVDGPSLTVVAVGNALNGAVDVTGGAVTFTPATNFNGVASFEYTVSDGGLSDVGLVTVTVLPVNDAPVAVDDAVAIAEDDPGTDVFVLANDGDIDGPGPLVLVDVLNPLNCTATKVANRVLVVPAPDFAGTASFDYHVGDGAGGLDLGHAVITVLPVNDAPVAAAVMISTDENSPVVVPLTATDIDSPSVTFAVGAPSSGAVGAVTSTGPLTATVTFTPTAGFTGLATFTVTASDGAASSAPALVTVTVVDAPVCGDGELDPGEQCDDTNNVGLDGCSGTCRTETLFFSEYVEGVTGSNKAIEIMNPLPTPASLVGCSLRLYSNGAMAPTSTLTLSQTIASHDVLVLCNPSASAPVLALCDVTATGSTINWNGDDAIELFCSGVSVDVFGQLAFDPGTAWGTGLTSTVDHTLRRKCTVTSGDLIGSDPFDPAVEWDGFAGDTFGDLGSYSCP
ncbi:MAG: tandem-95 repeat protein [Myxococcales bacterium]|nr:tandem-95 repeat protein [Myxococcales bacterium]